MVGPANNGVAVVVDYGPTCLAVDAAAHNCTAGSPIGTVNIAFATVTVCVPNTTTCQVIDHVMVDTGSSGLRIMSSVLNSTLATQLPALKVGQPLQPLLECAQFADGYAWGTVRNADVKIGNEKASFANVQIIGDSEPAPQPCQNVGANLDSVYNFGANGVLGVGLFVNDCVTGQTCLAAPLAPAYLYYGCPTLNTCNGIDVPSANQVANPVASFAADNNGVILKLPALTSSGAQTTNGTLVFGIDTASNNALTTAQAILAANAYTGNFFSSLTSISPPFTGAPASYSNSFLDSGSNGIFLPGTTIACDSTYGWFVPATTVNIAGTVQGSSTTNGVPTALGSAANIAYQIANATNLFNSGNTAFNNLGAPADPVAPPAPATCNSSGVGSATGSGINQGIDLGLPIFYGKNVYVALETATFTVGGTKYPGPFWAF